MFWKCAHTLCGEEEGSFIFKKIERDREKLPQAGLSYPNISAPPKSIIELPLISFYMKHSISGIRVTGSTVTTWSYGVHLLKKRVCIIHLWHIVDFLAFLCDLYLSWHKYGQLSLHRAMDTSQRIKLASFYIFKSSTRKLLSLHCQRYLTLIPFPISFHLLPKTYLSMII